MINNTANIKWRSSVDVIAGLSSLVPRLGEAENKATVQANCLNRYSHYPSPRPLPQFSPAQGLS